MSPWDWRQNERERRQKARAGVDTGYWLNTSTGVRHNRSCPNYRNTKRGRACRMCVGEGVWDVRGVRANLEMPRIVSAPVAN